MAWMTTDELGIMSGLTISADDEQRYLLLIEAAQNSIEAFLDRKLEKVKRTETHKIKCGGDVALKAYPIETVHSVTDASGVVVEYAVDKWNGMIRVKQPVDVITVTYTGGMDEIPTDVKYALALTVKNLHGTMESDGRPLMSERFGDYQVMYYNGQQAGNASMSSLNPAACMLLNLYRGRGGFR